VCARVGFLVRYGYVFVCLHGVFVCAWGRPCMCRACTYACACACMTARILCRSFARSTTWFVLHGRWFRVRA